MEQRRTGNRSSWSCRQGIHKSNRYSQTRLGSRSLSNAKVQTIHRSRRSWRMALWSKRSWQIALCTHNLPRCLHQTTEQVVRRLPWLEGYPYRRHGYTCLRTLPQDMGWQVRLYWRDQRRKSQSATREDRSHLQLFALGTVQRSACLYWANTQEIQDHRVLL